MTCLHSSTILPYITLHRFYCVAWYLIVNYFVSVTLRSSTWSLHHDMEVAMEMKVYTVQSRTFRWIYICIFMHIRMRICVLIFSLCVDPFSEWWPPVNHQRMIMTCKRPKNDYVQTVGLACWAGAFQQTPTSLFPVAWFVFEKVPDDQDSSKLM